MKNLKIVSRNIFLLFQISLLLITAAAVRAEETLQLLADSPDDHIRQVLEPLLPIAKRQMEWTDADLGVVLSKQAFDTDAYSHTRHQDQVWWVRRGEAENLTNFVRDFEAGVEIKEVRAFLIRPGLFDSAGALEAEVERLDSDRIHITRGGKDDRLASLVIGFDTAQPGDLLGVSIKTHESRPLDWKVWLTAEGEPIARVELRLKCDPGMAFAVFGSRFLKGQIGKEILKEKFGQITDLRLWADSIDPVANEPYSPPWHLQSPQFIVAWRATRVRTQSGLIWYYKKHWNQIAVEISKYEQLSLKKAKKTRKLAKEIASGLEPREAADLLFRFVRDELMDNDIRLYFDQDEIPTVDEILEARSGSAWEKAFVLVAMLRGQGLTADFVCAHNPENGNYFENYPSWGQMSEPLVRVSDQGREYWYDFRCRGCPPGEIRTNMQESEALVYRSDAWELDDRLWDQVAADAQGRDVNLFEFYMEFLKKKPWSRIVKTPGPTGKWAAWSEEEFVLGSQTGEDTKGRLEIRSLGRTPFKEAVDNQGSANEAGHDWALARYEPVQDATVLEISKDGADTLALSLDLECRPLAPPMGETWLLPPEVAFGEPLVSSWPEKRATWFYVPRNTQSRWVFRAPLPADWQDAELPANLIVNAELVAYQLKFEIKEGDLVISRIFVEQAGSITNPDKIAGIGAKLESINQVESTPVLLRKKAVGP